MGLIKDNGKRVGITKDKGWQSGFYQQEERGDSPADSPSINIFRQNRKNMLFSVKNQL